MGEVRQIVTKNMDEKMSEMEEKSAEVRRFTCRNMADMGDKASEMAR